MCRNDILDTRDVILTFSSLPLCYKLWVHELWAWTDQPTEERAIINLKVRGGAKLQSNYSLHYISQERKKNGKSYNCHYMRTAGYLRLLNHTIFKELAGCRDPSIVTVLA